MKSSSSSKRLALFGGGGLRSTIRYLQTIEREVLKARSRNHGVPLRIETVENLRLPTDKGTEALDVLTQCAQAHAEWAHAVVLCGAPLAPWTNPLAKTIDVPVISIGVAVDHALARLRLRKTALLGATTESEIRFWQESLGSASVLVPAASEATRLAEIAQRAADSDTIPANWQTDTARTVAELKRAGAEVAVLCAPDLERVLRAGEPLLPLVNAEETHAWMAAGWALHNP